MSEDDEDPVTLQQVWCPAQHAVSFPFFLNFQGDLLKKGKSCVTSQRAACLLRPAESAAYVEGSCSTSCLRPYKAPREISAHQLHLNSHGCLQVLDPSMVTFEFC